MPNNIDRLLVVILLLGLLLASVWVLAPFVPALFWAGILAFASWPLMRRLSLALGGRMTLSAAILTLGWILLVAGPLIMLSFNIVDHVRGVVELVQTFRTEGVPEAPQWLYTIPWFGNSLANTWNELDVRGMQALAAIKPYLGDMGNWLLAWSGGLGRGLLEVSLSLFLVFFFYRDGPLLAEKAQAVLERLVGERGDYYLALVADTVRRVVAGIIGTAAAQAVLALIGFLIAGVPGAVLLGLLTFVLSFVPMGPPLVWGPVSLWLFMHDHYGMGVFMLLWGLLVVSSVDNFLKPILISRGGNLPLVVVLLGVFGGLLAFGFMGLFVGPTLLAVTYSLLNDWLESRVRIQPRSS